MTDQSRANRIHKALTQGLKPVALEITDDSHKHAGHAGHRPGEATHFTVQITSDAFTGLNRLARQRLVYDLLADELAGGLHALALVTKAPRDRT
jgi:BolA protein